MFHFDETVNDLYGETFVTEHSRSVGHAAGLSEIKKIHETEVHVNSVSKHRNDAFRGLVLRRRKIR